jgi:Zn-dependent peptidase ImmA (M78 family)
MDAARLLIHEEELTDGFLDQFRRKAVRVGKVLKSALSKVLGVFDAVAGAVYLGQGLRLIQKVFLKLHETGHALLPWHRDVYYALQDCEKTLAPEVSEAFEREANVFASEVLFQIDTFTVEAADHAFGIQVPLKLSKKYGASVYSTIRRYVSTNERCCLTIVLDPTEIVSGDGYRARLRRVIPSKSFAQTFGGIGWPQIFTPDSYFGRMIPLGDRRMSRPVRFTLLDVNGVRHECVGEAFKTKYQTFILIHETASITRTVVAV